MKRINLFDAAVVVFIVALIPIAYGTYLLFRTPRPVIASVRRVDITKEERRVGGPNLVAKLKITGSGLRPMLRATIDDTPAIGFVFESPNSADLLVGAIKPGTHDLVLYDGVQEVARAPKGVDLAPTVARKASIRVRLDSPPEVVQLVKVDDHDTNADAAVTAVDKDSITLRVGFDDDLKPGTGFTLTTPGYVVKGTILRVTVEQP